MKIKILILFLIFFQLIKCVDLDSDCHYGAICNGDSQNCVYHLNSGKNLRVNIEKGKEEIIFTGLPVLYVSFDIFFTDQVFKFHELSSDQRLKVYKKNDIWQYVIEIYYKNFNTSNSDIIFNEEILKLAIYYPPDLLFTFGINSSGCISKVTLKKSIKIRGEIELNGKRMILKATANIKSDPNLNLESFLNRIVKIYARDTNCLNCINCCLNCIIL